MILIQPPTVQNWNSLVNKPSILSDNQISWDEIQNKPTTLAGYGITNGQPLGNELTALQDLSDSAGFLKKLGDGNYSIDVGNYLPLSAGGNVGIGTSAPSQLVSVGGTGGTIIGYGIEFSPGDQEVFALTANTATGEVRHFAFTNYFPTFYSNNTERMRITSAGNVGIGLVNPSTKLEVAGTITTTDMIVSATTPSTSPTTGASRVTGGQGVQGNQHIGGFTSLGGTAGGHPAIKIKVLEGITAATQGDYVSIPHGISIGKIVSITAYVDRDSNGALLVFPNYSYTPGYYYELIADNTYVTIVNHPTNSSVILSRKFIATIFYKE